MGKELKEEGQQERPIGREKVGVLDLSPPTADRFKPQPDLNGVNCAHCERKVIKSFRVILPAWFVWVISELFTINESLCQTHAVSIKLDISAWTQSPQSSLVNPNGKSGGHNFPILVHPQAPHHFQMSAYL